MSMLLDSAHLVHARFSGPMWILQRFGKISLRNEGKRKNNIRTIVAAFFMDRAKSKPRYAIIAADSTFFLSLCLPASERGGLGIEVRVRAKTSFLNRAEKKNQRLRFPLQTRLSSQALSFLWHYVRLRVRIKSY